MRITHRHRFIKGPFPLARLCCQMRPRLIRGEAHAETATCRLGANLFAKLVTLQAFRKAVSQVLKKIDAETATKAGIE